MKYTVFMDIEKNSDIPNAVYVHFNNPYVDVGKWVTYKNNKNNQY